MAGGELPHNFALSAADLKRLIDRTRFAISTEETRYYLNGIYLHAAKSDGVPVLRAVATDGHRLARVEVPLPDGAAGMPGVIMPRKTVSELRKLLDEVDQEVSVSLSDTQIQFAFGDHGADLEADRRHLPRLRPGHPARQRQDRSRSRCKDFAEAVDRVSAISTEKSRAGEAGARARQPDAVGDQPRKRHRHRGTRGRATPRAPMEIGFNARYLLDITEQIEGEGARFCHGRRRLADRGARRRRRQRALRADADARLKARPGIPCGRTPSPPSPFRRMIYRPCWRRASGGGRDPT